jgi:hypothetical protein
VGFTERKESLQFFFFPYISLGKNKKGRGVLKIGMPTLSGFELGRTKKKSPTNPKFWF